MNVRSKLIFPIIIATIFIWLMFQFVWEPLYLQKEKEHFVAQHVANLQNIASFLSHEITNKHKDDLEILLNDLVQKNTSWHSLIVKDKNRNILFPKNGQAALPNNIDTLYLHNILLSDKNDPSGELTVYLDLAPLYNEIEAYLFKLEFPIYILLLMTITAIIALQDSLITRPLKQLSLAVSQMAKGETDVLVPVNGHDEIGELSRLFDNMRREVHNQKSDLNNRVRNEHDLHKRLQKESKHLQQSILENIVDGIITINNRGKILSFNLAAEKIFLYPANEVIGKNINVLIGSSFEKSRHDNYLKDYIDKSKSPGIIGVGREVWAQRKNGDRFPMDLAISEVWHEGEQQFVGIIRDISIRKDMENKIKQAKFAAEKASQFKSQFLANMSHEIRTPMNGVIGMIDLARESTHEPEVIECLDTAYRSGTALLAILNDILDLSKIESGKLELEFIEFDLNSLITDVVHLFAKMASEKGLLIDYVFEQVPPKILVGDPTRIRQILSNLVSNAIKFSGKGSVYIKTEIFARTQKPTKVSALLDAVSLSDQGQWLEIRCSVKDTGIGIREDKLDSIFQNFTQADTSTTRHFGGTGLGLSISRQLVHAMGGEIQVDSTVGHGSTFCFHFPSFAAGDCLESEFPTSSVIDKPVAPTEVAAKEGQILPASRKTEPKPMQSKRFLVVDDNDVNKKVVCGILKKLGIESDQASNGQEALEKITERNGEYALIIMDVQMPVMDGYQATLKIRELENDSKNIPIVGLSADTEEETINKCLTAGMTSYMSKPITLEKLKENIKNYL